MKTADFKLSSYAPLLHAFTGTREERIAAWRGRTLSRIEAWRRAPMPKHSYGYDGEGRHRVRVIAPNPSREDLMGGALRDARPAHDVFEEAMRRGEFYRRDIHTGWYTNPDGDSARDGTGLCWGMVAYLGHSRWLAGYTLGGTDCGAYHLDTFYDNELEAARAADSLAQHVAEKEQEYQQRWREARDLEDAIEEKTARLRELLALRHKRCLDYVRSEIAEVIEAIRAARDTLATDYKGVL